jgi:signal transduction histidine kinase
MTVGELDGVFYVEDDGTGFGPVIVQQTAEAHGRTVEAVACADGGVQLEVTGAF